MATERENERENARMATERGAEDESGREDGRALTPSGETRPAPSGGTRPAPGGEAAAASPGGKGGRDAGILLGTIFNALGILLLAAVIVSSLPLAIPRLLGTRAYGVVSGSMEPNIPVGSLIYVEPAEPLTVQEGEVIAFRSGEAVVAHRVMRNAVDERAFITKGDANEAVDFESAPYEQLVGRVRFHIPHVGRFLMLYADARGKLSAAAAAVSGLVFTVLGGILTGSRGEDERAKRRRRGDTVRAVVMGVLLLVFVLSGAAVLSARREDRTATELYDGATEDFTAPSAAAAAARRDEPPAGADRGPERAEELLPPITVDFERLQAINGDVFGWLYCTDTQLNYPLLKGESNDDYIWRGYDGSSHPCGSIFEEASNLRGIVDSNVILYGHHMQNGSMFACLDKWRDQAYFDEHALMWILTPEGDFRVELFSVYTDRADSDVYTVYRGPSEHFTAYLKEVTEKTSVRSDVVPDPEGQIVMFSTCAYEFNNARTLIFGKLTPVATAGGRPAAPAG